MAIVEVKNTVTNKSLIKSLRDTDPIHHPEVIVDFIDAFGVQNIMIGIRQHGYLKVNGGLNASK